MKFFLAIFLKRYKIFFRLENHLYLIKQQKTTMKQYLYTILGKAKNNIDSAKLCFESYDSGGAIQDLMTALSELDNFVPRNTPESLVFGVGCNILSWALINDRSLVLDAIKYVDSDVMPLFKELVDQYQETPSYVDYQ